MIGEETVIEAGAERSCEDADAASGPDYWPLGIGSGEDLSKMEVEVERILESH